MLTNISNNQTELLPKAPPQSANSTEDQQRQPGNFNYVPVEAIQTKANELAQPDELQLEQTCHNTNKSIDQRAIEDLQRPIQFKNMEAIVNPDKYKNFISIYNSGIFEHSYTRYEYDHRSGFNYEPKQVNIKNLYAIMNLSNTTLKYSDKVYPLLTGLFENGHVFLMAPRKACNIVEDPNNPNNVLFKGDPSALRVDAIYSGRTFQEVENLIKIVHDNTPLSNHISHILEYE
ncbi:hypothetical protein ACTL6P_03830 [Endozoicomonas acroporae]|uniref:hypothetical protein n=1 Tax=Endozoicomonas acroporae TaxID=1701104 RepID=UPI000C7677DE|nr:hypothetical protein [Endozoicomonas acroporae]